jgi:hypothetical protein
MKNEIDLNILYKNIFDNYLKDIDNNCTGIKIRKFSAKESENCLKTRIMKKTGIILKNICNCVDSKKKILIADHNNENINKFNLNCEKLTCNREIYNKYNSKIAKTIDKVRKIS